MSALIKGSIVSSIIQGEFKSLFKEVKNLWAVKNQEVFFFQIDEDLKLHLLSDKLNNYDENENTYDVNLNKINSYASWKLEGYAGFFPEKQIESESLSLLSKEIESDINTLAESFEDSYI